MAQGNGPARIDAVWALQRAVEQLDDDELLLDARARERIVRSALGAWKRERERALAARNSRQMTLDTERAA